MLEKLADIEAHYDELGKQLEEIGDDYQRAADLAKERTQIETIVEKAREYRNVLKQIEEARSLESEDDFELRELAQADLASLQPRSRSARKRAQSPAGPQGPPRRPQRDRGNPRRHRRR